MEHFLDQNTLKLVILMITMFGCICASTWFIITKVKASVKIGSTGINLIGSPNVSAIPVSKHPEYLEFCGVFRELQINIKTQFRQWCVENGIEDLENAKWEVYKKERISHVLQISCKFFADNCFVTNIKVEDFVEKNNVVELITQYGNALFDSLKHMAQEVNEQIRGKDTELQDFVKKNLDDLLLEEANLPLHGRIPHISMLIFQCGQKMVEMHEMKNRQSVKKQMNKVEEYLLGMYNVLSVKYLSDLTEKLQKEN